jgi:hypothetical protein
VGSGVEEASSNFKTFVSSLRQATSHDFSFVSSFTSPSTFLSEMDVAFF